jgi:DNA-directed RNA polymerase specialized sigma24 family protein
MKFSSKITTKDGDKDALLRRGYPLAIEFYENCIVAKVDDMYLREKLYDATVDGLLAAIRTFKSGIGCFEGYLYFVVKRKWIQQTRCARWKRQLLSLSHHWRPYQQRRRQELADTLPSPKNEFALYDNREFFVARSARLSSQQAAAIRLRLETMTHREIGDALGFTPQWADTTLKNAYVALRGEEESL